MPKYILIRVDDDPGIDLWIIKTRFELNLFIILFTLCTILLLFGISIFCVDNEVYQNFLHTYVPAFLAPSKLYMLGISICVFLGATELWLVGSAVGSLLNKEREPNMTPRLSIIVFIICLVSGIGYAIYEFDKKGEILVETESDSEYCRHWSPYKSDSFSQVYQRGRELSILEIFSINEYSYRFNKTSLYVKIKNDGEINFTLLNEWRNEANIQAVNGDCFVRVGDDETWMRIPKRIFGSWRCEVERYYCDRLFEDVIHSGKFCIKVPTNLGYLEYKFKNLDKGED